jgi:hypothetical protein
MQYPVRFNYSSPSCFVVFSDRAVYLLQKLRIRGLRGFVRIDRGLLCWSDYPSMHRTAPFVNRGDLVTHVGTLPDMPPDDRLPTSPKGGVLVTVPWRDVESFVEARRRYGIPLVK